MGKREIIEVIKAHTKFLLTGHVNPDGDSIGCQLALAEALEQLGKEVSLQSADPVPAMYRRLPGASRVRRVAEIEGEFDVVILLECPTNERSGFHSIPADIVVNIDHHPDNQHQADVNWVNEKASAAGVLVYSLVLELGCEITGSMAENLFVAILTDTGSFTFSNTTANALDIAAELMRKGVDPEAVARKVYRSYPPEKLDLIGTLLSGMQRYFDGAVTVMTLGKEEIEKRGYAKEIFEDVVNMPLMASTVKVSILGREDKPGEWRFSMRSKGDVDIGALARKFGGGGHRNAAGFRKQGQLEEIVEETLKELDGQLAADKQVPTD